MMKIRQICKYFLWFIINFKFRSQTKEAQALKITLFQKIERTYTLSAN